MRGLKLRDLSVRHCCRWVFVVQELAVSFDPVKRLLNRNISPLARVFRHYAPPNADGDSFMTLEGLFKFADDANLSDTVSREQLTALFDRVNLRTFERYGHALFARPLSVNPPL